MEDEQDSLKELNQRFFLLMNDALSIVKAARDSDDDVAKRSFVRAVFAFIEGVTHGLKMVALDSHIRKEDTFSRAEESLLLEEAYELNEKGQPIVKPKYLTLPRNIKFAFEQQARVTFSSFKLDLDGEGWSSLMSSVSVRNRLTHPKSLIELHVSDQEVEGAEKALHWFAISYVSALADSYRALNRKLEEAQEILSKTETALDKGLKKSV